MQGIQASSGAIETSFTDYFFFESCRTYVDKLERKVRTFSSLKLKGLCQVARERLSASKPEESETLAFVETVIEWLIDVDRELVEIAPGQVEDLREKLKLRALLGDLNCFIAANQRLFRAQLEERSLSLTERDMRQVEAAAPPERVEEVKRLYYEAHPDHLKRDFLSGDQGGPKSFMRWPLRIGTIEASKVLREFIQGHFPLPTRGEIVQAFVDFMQKAQTVRNYSEATRAKIREDCVDAESLQACLAVRESEINNERQKDHETFHHVYLGLLAMDFYVATELRGESNFLLKLEEFREQSGLNRLMESLGRYVLEKDCALLFPTSMAFGFLLNELWYPAPKGVDRIFIFEEQGIEE